MTTGPFLDWRRSASVENLIDLLESFAEKTPNATYCDGAGVVLSYSDTLQALRGFASLYGDAIKDKTVAVFMGNSPFFTVTYLGVLFCGGVPALLNAATPPKTGTVLLKQLAPILTFSDQPLSFDAASIVVGKDTLQMWIKSAGAETSCAGRNGDPATIFYTGGTTGVPKRVLYSHAKILSAGERMQWGWPLQEGEVFLPIAPFSHIYGYLMGICMPLQCGGSLVIPERFKPSEVLDLVERKKISVLGGGPPAVYQALLSDPDLKTRDLSSLRVCPGGGAPIPVEVHKRWKDATGLSIHEGYGMTEIAPIAVNTEELGNLPGAAGKPVPDTKIEIVDLEKGNKVQPIGQAGEIRVQGPHMMDGYTGNPEETSETLRDGWIYTGDVGVIDEDGFLIITDRKKNVILYKGFNVFPREVEEALIAHPDVVSASVVGTPDERSGEMVFAFVTCRAGAEPDPATLIEHCRQYLVAYRLPGRIQQLDSLPLTTAGKVDRLRLQSMAAEELSTEDA